jgi:hypothetical protein
LTLILDFILETSLIYLENPKTFQKALFFTILHLQAIKAQ